MTTFADLHIHTTFSDSSHSPKDVVQEANEFGLKCIAITDHDTVEGIKPTIQEARELDLEVIAGIELSSQWQGTDIHVLGYLIDFKSEALIKQLQKIQDERMTRMASMIEKLKGLGVDNIELDEVCGLVESKSVGRLHLARLLHQKGWVSSIHGAFQKYIGDGGAAYIEKPGLTPFEAIESIRKFGGVAVLAHPMVTNKDELIPSLVKRGLQGLEVYYPNCQDSTIKYYERIAQKHGLIMTGGSDSHGDAKSNTFIGKARVPYDVVEQLKAAAQ